MENKKQNVQENEKKQTQEKKQDVLELIEDSLGGVSGGVRYGGMTNVDDYSHFGNQGAKDINPKWEQMRNDKNRWVKER